ncbi:hypothetical protein D9611_015072 [Ephemerocybe angulata]|nr:hypothetical protein D9611_015072 [Tulosesus angulatus]
MADASTDPEANGVISQGPSGNRGSTYALSKGQAHASGLGKEASSKGNSASAPVVGGGSHETPIVIDEEDDAPDPAPAKPSKSKIAAQLLAKLTTEKDQGVVPNPASAPSKGRAPNPASAPSKGRAPNPAPAPSKGRAPNPAPAPSKAEVEAKPGKGDPLKFADIRVMKKQLTRLRYQFIILIFLQLVNSDMTSGYAFGIGLAMLVLHFA